MFGSGYPEKPRKNIPETLRRKALGQFFLVALLVAL